VLRARDLDLRDQPTSGTTIAASGQKTLGRVFSRARRRGLAAPSSDDVEVGAQAVSLSRNFS
jgi:hypothetical protein